MSGNNQKSQGWVPHQHGVWAMLIVPFVVGAVLRSRQTSLDVWLVPLAFAELAAYLCFNALTSRLRAAPVRRGSYTVPVLVYGGVAGALGLLALVLGGWPILSWLPIALPFGALAVWLASRRQDRSPLSGFATVTLAVGMALVVRFVTPGAMLDDLPGAARDLAIVAALWAYFFGTVWHVKAMIRQRGQRPARLRSIAWHGGATTAAAVASVAGLASPLWIGFFAATTARTWWMTRPEVAPRIKPIQIGVMEMTLSVFALACSLL